MRPILLLLMLMGLVAGCASQKSAPDCGCDKKPAASKPESHSDHSFGHGA